MVVVVVILVICCAAVLCVKRRQFFFYLFFKPKLFPLLLFLLGQTNELFFFKDTKISENTTERRGQKNTFDENILRRDISSHVKGGERYLSSLSFSLTLFSLFSAVFAARETKKKNCRW